MTKDELVKQITKIKSEWKSEENSLNEEGENLREVGQELSTELSGMYKTLYLLVTGRPEFKKLFDSENGAIPQINLSYDGTVHTEAHPQGNGWVRVVDTSWKQERETRLRYRISEHLNREKDIPEGVEIDQTEHVEYIQIVPFLDRCLGASAERRHEFGGDDDPNLCTGYAKCFTGFYYHPIQNVLTIHKY
jgi:hypothetical protein